MLFCRETTHKIAASQFWQAARKIQDTGLRERMDLVCELFSSA